MAWVEVAWQGVSTERTRPSLHPDSASRTRELSLLSVFFCDNSLFCDSGYSLCIKPQTVVLCRQAHSMLIPTVGVLVSTWLSLVETLRQILEILGQPVDLCDCSVLSVVLKSWN